MNDNDLHLLPTFFSLLLLPFIYLYHEGIFSKVPHSHRYLLFLTVNELFKVVHLVVQPTPESCRLPVVQLEVSVSDLTEREPHSEAPVHQQSLHHGAPVPLVSDGGSVPDLVMEDQTTLPHLNTLHHPAVQGADVARVELLLQVLREVGLDLQPEMFP